MTNRINPEHYLCYRSMTKYDRLAKLIDEYYKGSDSVKINLYIDISSFLLSLINNKSELDKKDDLFISAWVINMCAHYRNFFKTRYGVYANIYLIYSNLADNGSEYRKICPEYNKECVVNPTWINVINMNMDILANMCQYIPNVQFLRTKYEFMHKSLYVYYTGYNARTTTMIISNDVINSQLTNFDNICMLYPSKYKGEDQSYIISKNNCIQHYIYKVKKCSNITALCTNPSFLSLILATTGYNKRGFKSIYSITQVIKALNKLISDNMLKDETVYGMERLLSLISSTVSNKHQFNQLILDRFKVLDALCYILYYDDNTDIDIVHNGFANLYNPQAIYEINDKLFKNYELDILAL